MEWVLYRQRPVGDDLHSSHGPFDFTRVVFCVRLNGGQPIRDFMSIPLASLHE